MTSTMAVAPRLHRMTTPYRGLMPYSEDDWPYFFGREHESEVIGANLMASRLTLLYGSSGVGKTSVLRAGVGHKLNELAKQNVLASGEAEHVAVIFSEWRTEPIAGLLNAVATAIAATCGPSVATASPPDSSRLTEALQWWTERTDCELLIVLDQFEEYFLYHPNDEAGDFADQLPLAIRRPDLRVNFVLSLREDTLARLDRFKGRIPNLFENYLRLELLERKSARESIELPIQEYNRGAPEDQQITIEPDLVNAVLDQIASEVEQPRASDRAWTPTTGAARIDPSYLQVVMDRVWTAETASGGRVLRRETLNQLGSAREILKTYLDRTLGGLSTDSQDVAAAIFHHLVTPSGMKIAHTVHDLAQYTELSDESVQAVVLLLAGDLRILRSVAGPTDSTLTRYEIYHDRLADAILGWRTRHLAMRQASLAARQLEEELASAEQRLQEAIVAEKVQADERVALAVRFGVRRTLLPILLVLATWLGSILFVIGAFAVPALLVHRLERPVSWGRSFVIGIVWAILGLYAAGLVVAVTALLTRIARLRPDPQPTPQIEFAAQLVGLSIAFILGFAAHAVVGAKLTGWLLAEERTATAHSRQRHIYLSVKLAVVSWLGLFVLGIPVAIWLVHSTERPVTWARSIAIGALWAVAAVPAVFFGIVINEFVYFVAGTVFGASKYASETAYLGGLLADGGALATNAALGGLLMNWLLRPIHAQWASSANDASAELDRHATGQAELGLELEQRVPQLAGNRANR